MPNTNETNRQTYGDALGTERMRELADQYLEVVPDDADPNDPHFRRDVSLTHARDLGTGPEAWFAYECLHFFVWREQMYCRDCGCPLLPAWMIQHREKLHGLHFGF